VVDDRNIPVISELNANQWCTARVSKRIMTAKKQRSSKSKKAGGIKKENDGNKTQRSKKKVSSLAGFGLAPLIVVAIAIAIHAFKIFTHDDEAVKNLPLPDSNVASFLEEACKIAFCHKSLVVAKRTLRARKRISAGEDLLRIPRSMQIWDLDAMRDPFVQKHLFSARHKRSGNRLGSEAYLAAYLALELHRAKESPEDMNPMRKAYLEFLPTLADLKSHPLLWDKEEATQTLGERSPSNLVLRQYRNMVDSEYNAFQKASPDFDKMIPIEAYASARINVLTRSYPMGPPPDDEALDGRSLSEELKSYYDDAGIDFMDEAIGCRAMVPIADLLNHHPLNTAGFNYEVKESGKQSFVVNATRRSILQNIEAGAELMISYGDFTDAHLFARYGFVNGDGSGTTEASIGFHHDILNLHTKPQFNLLAYSGITEAIDNYQRAQIRKYLIFDDGYVKCIEGPESSPDEAELKRLKFEHLVKIANIPNRWTVALPPRNDISGPALSTETPITIEPPAFPKSALFERTSISNILSTCRLISVINSDYGGRALDILSENMDKKDFRLWEGNDALEFRSLACIKRYIDSESALMMRQEALPKLHQIVRDMNENDFGSSKWAAFHIKFADMQTFVGVSQLVQSKLIERFSDKKDNPPTEYSMMEKPCSLNFTDFLLNDKIRKAL
jgi:hypothetical protein